MSKLVRFGVSLEKELLVKFDRDISQKDYPTRSKAIGDLIRESFVKKEWIGGSEVAGAITLVYNHHRRELVNKLTDIQHDFGAFIISSQHVHLDHDNCLEIVVVKGKPKDVEKLAQKLKATKGVKHSSLTMTTTGKKV
ncbi:MAG: nickel-responsive transcriptional regulator NikR [Elusimicrobia bacterium CG08_land_8_20_14_0_20_44_26]|nr:MAG: nickel-responsive transcriptional regulator NikR [Elusimicrobia bacterium CG08_land_8_20_14_0_20_44_26]